ncbi:hypothetical protein ETA_15600 [Erwinia tasmaniensis Et1/99]|uniref:Uncharacterized protein n=1 Tax=Erwinia tasmaniensis (strain DSM 17950 / CFBP 7177 / CIP 109463 / NCPPB 4357 / Et1/99) TaxID=465817 RepID=B2VJ35_ERWT9|nr:hypothetical protein ETA_15600 [Erwinia tasmaniensis Et1/99]
MRQINPRTGIIQYKSGSVTRGNIHFGAVYPNLKGVMLGMVICVTILTLTAEGYLTNGKIFPDVVKCLLE